MYTILWIQKLKKYENIYINVEVTNICPFWKHEVFQEELIIYLIVKWSNITMHYVPDWC